MFIPVNCMTINPIGTVLGYSECNDSVNEIASIVYSFSGNTLYIRHKNAVYNCCFKDISAAFTVTNNKINTTSELVVCEAPLEGGSHTNHSLSLI